MRKIKMLAFRVFKKRKIYWRLCKFIDENYIGLSGWGKADRPVRSDNSTVEDSHIDFFSETRYSRERPSKPRDPRLPEYVAEEDGDFEAIFDIFNKRRPSYPQSQIEKVEQLVAAVEAKDKFTASMLSFIAAKGLSDSDVYNNVFMDRRLFNHIRNDPDYQPSKRTALLIAVSLKLTYEETQSLLETAGYTLAHSNKRDLIVEFFIREGNYNIFEINEMLNHFKQPLLMKCK